MQLKVAMPLAGLVALLAFLAALALSSARVRQAVPETPVATGAPARLAIPPLDATAPDRIETATFALG